MFMVYELMKERPKKPECWTDAVQKSSQNPYGFYFFFIIIILFLPWQVLVLKYWTQIYVYILFLFVFGVFF